MRRRLKAGGAVMFSLAVCPLFGNRVAARY